MAAYPYNAIVTHPDYQKWVNLAHEQLFQMRDLGLIPKPFSFNFVCITIPTYLQRLASHPLVAEDMIGLTMATVIRSQLQYEMPEYKFGERIFRTETFWKIAVYLSS